MAAATPKVIEGVGLMATLLDSTGAPVAAATANSRMYGRGYTTVTTTVTRDEGTAQTVRDASGAICAYRPAKPSVTGIDLVINYCGVPIEALVFALGALPIIDGEAPTPNTVGFALPDQFLGLSNSNLDLRIYQSADDGAAPSGKAYPFGMHVFPKVINVTLDSITDIGEEFLQFSMRGTAQANPQFASAWATDPVTIGNAEAQIQAGGPYGFVQADALPSVAATTPSVLDAGFELGDGTNNAAGTAWAT